MAIPLTMKRVLGLTIGLAVLILAVPLKSSKMVVASAPRNEAQAADPADAPPDLQKQIEDALKELDKLEKINPDEPDRAKQQIEDVRQQVRQRLFQGINPNPIVFGPGVNVVRRPGIPNRLGISMQRPTAILHEQLKFPVGQGLIVIIVAPADGPAGKAGIQRYDILLEWDGKPVPSDIALFQKTVLEAKAGVEINATVLRQGQKETIKGIKLAELPAEAFAPVPPNGPGIIFPPNIPIAPQVGGGFGGVIQMQGNGNGAESMRVQVVNDNFTIQYAAGGLNAVVKGTRANGKSTPNEIVIRDGDTNVSVATVDEVPERFRATIDRMLDRVK